MPSKTALLLLAAALAALCLPLPGECGTLTLRNDSAEAAYCVTFDLWSASGPGRRSLTSAPGSAQTFQAPPLRAIGKLAVYRLPEGTTCDHPPAIPEARHDPGLLLPMRSFTVHVLPDGQVCIDARRDPS
ncbi:hypothetical protein [Desulfocurvus vexinensis]|uniref:hypothetical protein n=1 Tax=Desulfocurvus vexinensis TaxID=399548 RepID=UPI00048AD3A6|nr:hypothetical protein [Desulfocurvus vexinensis]